MSTAREQSPFTKVQKSLYAEIKRMIETSENNTVQDIEIACNPRTLKSLQETHGLIRIDSNGFITLTHIPENLTPVQRFVYIEIIDAADKHASVEKKENWNWKTLNSLKSRGLVNIYDNVIVLNLIRNIEVTDEQKQSAKFNAAMKSLASNLNAEITEKSPGFKKIVSDELGISFSANQCDKGFTVENLDIKDETTTPVFGHHLSTVAETFDVLPTIADMKNKNISNGLSMFAR